MAEKDFTTGLGDNVIPFDRARRLALNVKPGETTTGFFDFVKDMDPEEQQGFFALGIHDALNRIKVLEHCVFALTLLLAEANSVPWTSERKRDFAKDLNIDLDNLKAEAKAQGLI